VLPLAVGKTTLELADSGERVTEGCPAVTKGCSAPLLVGEVRFTEMGGSPAEGCSSAPLAVGKIALEFAVSNGTKLDGCSTLPLAIGRITVRFTESGGMTTEGCSALPLAVGRSKVRFAVSAGMTTEGCAITTVSEEELTPYPPFEIYGSGDGIVKLAADAELSGTIGAVTKGAVPTREAVEFTAKAEIPVPIGAVPRGAVPIDALVRVTGRPVRSLNELLNMSSVFVVLGLGG
jgi:hypothetical protein